MSDTAADVPVAQLAETSDKTEGCGFKSRQGDVGRCLGSNDIQKIKQYFDAMKRAVACSTPTMRRGLMSWSVSFLRIPTAACSFRARMS